MPEFEGFYDDMPFAVYAAAPALNGTALMHMRRSPMKYRHELDNPSPATPAMMLGTATHRLILEPNKVGDFAVWGEAEDQKVRRGGVWEAFKAAHAGRQIVTVDERDAMVGMAVAARKNLPIRKYADAKGKTEVSMFWREGGRRFKGRVDKIVTAGGPCIFDLKTTRDCHSWRFGGQAYALGYHCKMALYWRGYKTITGDDCRLRLGAIESKAPHESTVFRITPDVLLQGLEDLDALIKKVDECEQLNAWPAEHEEETDLLLPSWVAGASEDLSEFAMETEA